MKKMGKVSNYFAGKCVGLFCEMEHDKPGLLKQSTACTKLNNIEFSEIALKWESGKAEVTLKGANNTEHTMECSTYSARMIVKTPDREVPMEEVIGTSVKAWNALWNTMKNLWFEGASDFGKLYEYKLKELN